MYRIVKEKNEREIRYTVQKKQEMDYPVEMARLQN